MNNNKSRTIAVNGILIALMLVLTTTMLFAGGMAFLPLTVLVVGMVIMGKWTAIILAFTFGLVSFISAFIFPSPTAMFFQNPLVSLLPRILSAIIAFCVFKLSQIIISKIDKKLKKPLNKYVSKSISIALGAIFVVFLNTLLVLSMIWILYNGAVDDIKKVIMGLITINFVVEIIVTPIISIPIVFAVEKFLKRNRKQVITDKDILEFDQNNMIENGDNQDNAALDNSLNFDNSCKKQNENNFNDISRLDNSGNENTEDTINDLVSNKDNIQNESLKSE